MVDEACDAFSSWLRDQPPDTFSTLEEALKGWVDDYDALSCGVYSTGGDYTLFLQVAVRMFALAAEDIDSFGDVLPSESLNGQHSAAAVLPKDSLILDERWYRRKKLGYMTPGRERRLNVQSED